MIQLFEGKIAVKAALLGKHREVYELIVDETKHDKDTRFIIAKAHEAGVPITKLSRSKIDALAQGKTHGGILCKVGDYTYDTIANHLEEGFIALVDGIEDPYNFGYICRSLYAAGCTLLLVKERNWLSSGDVVVKASAGASEQLPIALLEEDTIDTLKQHGYRFVCGNRKEATNLFEADLKGKILLGVGGEMRGLSATIANQADLNVFIPYGSNFRNSLNGSSATSVIAFEVYRQNH